RKGKRTGMLPGNHAARPEGERVAALLYAATTLRTLLSRLHHHPPITSATIPVVHWSRPRPLLALPTVKRAGDGRLPSPWPIYERTADVAAVSALVASPAHQMVVVKGFPGVGKTTLALQVGYAHLPPRGAIETQQAFDTVIWVAPEDCSSQRPALT